MSIRFKCQHCKKGLVVKEQMAGKKALCPACKKPLVVPAPRSHPADLEAFAASALSDEAPAAAGEKNDALASAAPIEVTCPFCAEPVKFDAELGGKRAPCPNPECRRIIEVPRLERKKQKDWRDVKTGPSAAVANQPEQLDGAWGTATHKAKVSQEALLEADAILEEEEPVGIGGWIKRGLLAGGILGLIVLVVWFMNRRAAESREKEGITLALEAVEGEKADKDFPRTWAALIYCGAGEHRLRKGEVFEAQKFFNTARNRMRSLPKSGDKSVERDLLCFYLALPQVDLGGNEEEIRDKKRLEWDAVVRDLTKTLGEIGDPEVRLRAVREVGTLLLKRKPGAAGSLAGPLIGDAEVVDANAVFMKSQQKALAMAWNKNETEKPNPKNKLPDWELRFGFPEGWARQGNLQEAKRYINEDLWPEEQFPAALGVAAALQSEGKDCGEFVALAEELSKTKSIKKISAWQTLEMVRLCARHGSADKAAEWLKRLPKQMKAWGDLEIFLADLARSETKAEATRIEDIGDKDSLPRGLAWVALARHNARLGYRNDVTEFITTDSPERSRVAALLHLGTALGTQDRRR